MAVGEEYGPRRPSPQDPRQWHFVCPAGSTRPRRDPRLWFGTMISWPVNARTWLPSTVANMDRCNEHRFDELGEFVDQNVEVNGAVHGFLLIDDCWLGAHLTDTGTSVAGGFVTIQEFAIYRVAGGRIVAVWGDLDEDRLAAS